MSGFAARCTSQNPTDTRSVVHCRSTYYWRKKSVGLEAFRLLTYSSWLCSKSNASYAFTRKAALRMDCREGDADDSRESKKSVEDDGTTSIADMLWLGGRAKQGRDLWDIAASRSSRDTRSMGVVARGTPDTMRFSTCEPWQELEEAIVVVVLEGNRIEAAEEQNGEALVFGEVFATLWQFKKQYWSDL